MRSFSVWLGGVALVAACGQQSSSSDVQLDTAVVKTQSSALAAAATAAENSNDAEAAAQVGAIGNNIAALIPSTARATHGRAVHPTATSGSISVAGGKISCNSLAFDVPALGHSVVDGESLNIGASHVAVTCSFTYGTGTLAGSLHATGNTTVNDVAYSWDATLTATDLTFTSRAMTGGSVSVDATVSTSSTSNGDESFHATGSVAFP